MHAIAMTMEWREMENALEFFSEEIKLKCKVKLNFIFDYIQEIRAVTTNLSLQCKSQVN